jgi:succinate-semialdehyde dehydrogenase/glutarate-semialdehyde dehydrogenase
MGPLNNENVATKMDRHVADAIEHGAKVITGGSRRAGQPTDLYWEPTLLDGVSTDSMTAWEETFGPIAPVIPVASLDQAIEMTNGIGYGLVAAIFTPDLQQGLEFADRVRAGSVHVNETSNYFETHLPFGGAARSSSGIGRTGGRHIMDEMTEFQTVTVTA